MIRWLNKNKKELLFVIISTIIFCVPLYQSQIYAGDDLLFHLNRLIGIRDAFIDGQFLPKIYPYTNNGYGYATPLFYCDLFLYPFSIIHYLGMPLVYCYKLMIFFYAFIGNLITVFVAKKVFKKELIYYLVSIMYIFGHYRILDGFSRAAFGEYLALSFVPLVLCAFYEVLILNKESYILLGISFSLLLLSHNITFALYCILFAILCLIYIILNRKRFDLLIKQFIVTIKAIILAIVLCLWFIVPMFEQFALQKFWVNEYGEIYQISNNLINLKDLFKPFLTVVYNKSIHTIANLNCLNYILLFVPLLGIFIKKEHKWIDILSVVAYIFLLCSIGFIPIHKLSIFNVIQFSFRWYIIIYPLLAISSGYIIACCKKKYLIILATLYLFANLFTYNCSIINSTNFINNDININELYDFDDILHKDYNEKQISGGEYLPITIYNDYLEETTFIKRINKDGKYEDVVYDYNRYFSNMDFEYTSNGNELLMMPLTYYKGYAAYGIKDGIKHDLEVINIDTYAKVGFRTLEGQAHYYVEYSGTLLQHITLTISLISLFCICIYSIFNRRKKHEEKDIICK